LLVEDENIGRPCGAAGTLDIGFVAEGVFK